MLCLPCCIALALGLLQVDRADVLPDWVQEAAWLYNGGGTGARTLLGAIAASSIGVASTVFSITIAALSLAAAQMGPRLLRNFTRDRGVQISLGAFLGTFSYALMVLVYFVDHMASRINVDTTRRYVDMFWELIDEILNAVLFVLIGMEVLLIAFSRPLSLAGAAAIAVTRAGTHAVAAGE